MVKKTEFKRRKEPRLKGGEMMRLFAAAMHAADELGLDADGLVREQLRDEGILPKAKNDNP